MYQSISSSLFRISAYIFLQIIPSRLLRVPIPVFYTLYLTSLYLVPRPSPPSEKQNKDTPPPKRPRNALATLLFTLPSPSRLLTATNFLLNALIFAAVLDFAASPYFDTASDVVFTRVGAVYPDSVKVTARYPAGDGILERQVKILYRDVKNESTPWIQGPVLNLTAEGDWVDTASITQLWPSTSYEYVLADPLQHDALLPYPTHPIPFKTFPDPTLPSPSKFKFAATSCIVPNFPYRGPQHRRSIKGFDLFADALDKEAYETSAGGEVAKTEFLLFLGDFIYADVPVYFGGAKEAYRRLYRRNYASASYRRVYERLPVIHAYDDHEFIDNYAGNSQALPPFPNASSAYDSYAGKANYDGLTPDDGFYTFEHGDVAFFVLDTRKYRAELGTSMLGERQIGALDAWLHRVNHTASFKFIVSSVPFTQLFTYDAKIDTWAAYPAEKKLLLSTMQTVQGVVVISGDRHQFAAVEFNAPPVSVSSDGNGTVQQIHGVLEVSTSPLSMFYIPFVDAMDRRTAEAFTTTRNRTVTRAVTKTKTGAGVEGGEEVQVVEEVQEKVQIEETLEVPYERALEYISKGNYKWSTFEVDTRDEKRPVLRVETMIDGKPAYHLEVLGAPIVKSSQTGLSALVGGVGGGFGELLGRFGVWPRRWF